MSDFTDDDPETVILLEKYKKSKASAAGEPSGWTDVHLADWANKDIPPRTWIWEDWIPLGEVVGLYGAPGIQKTDWSLQLCIAASLGLLFCGSRLAHICTYALFCEDGEEEIIRRCKRIADFYGRGLGEFTGFHFASLVGADDIEFVTFNAAGQMERLPAMKLFQEHLVRHTANLVVLDTLPDFFGGDEIKRRHVTQFVRALSRLAREQNCTILFTAHPSLSGINTKTLSSGSTGWEGKVRVRLTLRDAAGEDEEGNPPVQLSDRRILRREKSSYARQGDEIEMLFQNGGFSVETTGPVRGQMRDLQADNKFMELLDKVRKIGDYVNNNPQAHGKYAPAIFSTRSDRAGFTKPEFVRAMRRLFVAERIRIIHVRANGKFHPEIAPS